MQLETLRLNIRISWSNMEKRFIFVDDQNYFIVVGETTFFGLCLHNLQSSTPDDVLESEPELEELDSESESEQSEPESLDTSGRM